MSNRTTILTELNKIAKNEIHDKSTFVEMTSEESKISETGIDSFDFIMFFMKLGEEFNVDSKVFKDELEESDPTVKTIIDIIERQSKVSA